MRALLGPACKVWSACKEAISKSVQSTSHQWPRFVRGYLQEQATHPRPIVYTGYYERKLREGGEGRVMMEKRQPCTCVFGAHHAPSFPFRAQSTHHQVVVD